MMKVKGRDQKRMAKVDPLKEVPEAQISRIMSTSNRLIWRALQEGRKERDAAATALQPSASRVSRIFFK
jgi:hypothetical protein